jgi:SAM-dependent methyltransferase
MGTLVEREKEFHEHFYRSQKRFAIAPHILFESPAAFENKFILEFFGSLKGLTVIDVGAGSGETSVYFALQGAHVVWTDVSEAAQEKAEELASAFDVKEHIDFRLGDLNETLTQCPAADRVYGNGILHHLDLARLPGLMGALLKEGGKFAFVEPLRYNPLIHLYRAMATQVRSPDEKPLGFEAVEAFKRHFRVAHREFWLASLAVFIKFYLFDRVHPNDQPYWKKIFYDIDSCKAILFFTGKLDSFLTRLWPLNYLCWNTVLYGQK